MIPLQEAQCVLAVARTGSFRKAAADVYLSQPAVATYVDRLERRLNMTVFERTRSGTQLTSAGRQLLPHLESLVDVHDAIERECMKVGRTDTPTLTIASHRLGLIVTLPPALRVMAGVVEGLSISTRHAVDNDLSQLVRAGEVDLGVGYRRTGAGTDDPSLEEVAVAETHGVLFAPAGHALAARTSITAADLAGETLIALRSPLSRATTDAYVEGVPDIRWVFTEDTQLALRMVEEGVGVSLSVGAASAIAPDNVVTVDLEPLIPVEFTLVKRAEAELAPPAAILWDILAGVPARL